MKKPWIIIAIVLSMLCVICLACFCLAWSIFNISFSSISSPISSPGSPDTPVEVTYSSNRSDPAYPDEGGFPAGTPTPQADNSQPWPTSSTLPPDWVDPGIPPEEEAEATQPTPSSPAAFATPPRPSGAPSAPPMPCGRELPCSAAAETLKTLQEADVPVNDLIEVAARLEGKTGIAPTLQPPDAPYRVGDQKSFWVFNQETNQAFQVGANLQYVTDHLYFWIDESIPFNQRDLKRLADTFEEQIYPNNRAFFGSEWTPGIDGDPHLYVLYVRGLGGDIAGYFSTNDEYPPEASAYSNAHEMFMLSATENLSHKFTYAILAHEFQHMIHWYRDRNEELWMNEGFSDLAALLNGYGVGGHDWVYTLDPDIQLNDWPVDNSEDTIPHYGAAFLFMAYFLDRFGEGATQALVAEPSNGMDSIDQVLSSLDIKDPITGEPIGADDVFADWVVASYLNDEDIADGRYTYHNYPEAPVPDETEMIEDCGVAGGDAAPGGTPVPLWTTRQVSQYGVDYIRIRCRGDFTIEFEGAPQTSVLPTDPHSGQYAFWSNRGDESDMTLTRQFDFTGIQGPLTLNYWTWYDLEKDYDYVYLLASTDGKTWQFLETPSGTPEDPVGNSYGWAYTGDSGDQSQPDGPGVPQWIQESVDLSQFAGEQVILRFEYITDSATHGEGLLIDDLAIPEVGYFSDFESDDGGWAAEGFVRIQNALPQTYKVSLITLGKDPRVETYTLPGDLSGENKLSLPVNAGSQLFFRDVDEVILVVSGTARFTRQDTPYRFRFTSR